MSIANFILPAVFVVFYLGVVRPRQKQMKALQDQRKSVGVGNDVVLTSGIFGRVVSIGDDEAHIEIAPQTIIRIDRRAIARTVPVAIAVSSSEESA